MRQLVLPSGRRLAWREAGTGPPLVLLHGWSSSSAVFAEVLPLLADERRVLAPDLPGHGASDPPAEPGLEGLCRALASWLGALDCPAIDLLGWSLGGQAALRLAQQPEPEVRRLLLVATTPRFVAAPDWACGLSASRVRALARSLRQRYAATLGDFFTSQFVAGELPPQRLREILGFAVRDGRLPDPATAREGLAILRDSDLRAELPAVRCPVLVHQGDRDTITLPSAAAALAAALPGARLQLAPGLGHAPFLSRPAQAVRLWKEFLE